MNNLNMYEYKRSHRPGWLMIQNVQYITRIDRSFWFLVYVQNRTKFQMLGILISHSINKQRDRRRFLGSCLLYCTVLYFTVPYCTLLYCTVLYCTLLHCRVLYCTLLYSTALYLTVLYCTCTFRMQKNRRGLIRI